MSTHVFFITACAWFVLAPIALGQVVHRAEVDQAKRVASQESDARDWESLAASGPISNAPRSVSYAESHESLEAHAFSGSSQSKATADNRAADAPMPLPPRSKRQSRQAKSSTGASSGHALITVLSSLAIVLAVFFAFVWVTRRAAPKGMAPLAKEVVESLGRAPLLGRQQMQLIRVGNKLVLLSVTASGADTLTEITDPVEVDRLSGLCRQAQAGSISNTFRQVLAQAAVEPATPSLSSQRQARRPGAREPHRA